MNRESPTAVVPRRVLIVLLGAIGLSAVTGYLDYVLLPAIGIFVVIVIYALWRRQPA